MPEYHLDASRIDGPEACRRILLVGEDNPLSTKPEYALYHEPSGCAGSRLQSKILGVRARQTYLPMWRTNLCVGGWDREMAAARAQHLIGRVAPWSIIVTLGAKVLDVFSRLLPRGLEMFQRDTVPGIHLAIKSGMPGSEYPTSLTFVALPHPSGRNTTWNDASNIARARSLLAEVAPDIQWGELQQETRQRRR